MSWRWDQGRLEYFRFENIRRIAKALASVDGFNLLDSTDSLREVLSEKTPFSFSSGPNKLWRNYSRVFGTALLAVNDDGSMRCTEICHSIAKNDKVWLSPDTYFATFSKRFYFPSPVFVGYRASGIQCFPVCSLIKFFLAKVLKGEKAAISINDIFRYLIANDCTGSEPVDHYARLKSRTRTLDPAEERQLREFVIFISQMSIFMWANSQLVLDVNIESKEAIKYLNDLATPLISTREDEPTKELLKLGSLSGLVISPKMINSQLSDDVFIEEGSPSKVTHLRYERKPKLRSLFFARKTHPFICDMCGLNVSELYPWTENILELHHLLPLASPIRVETKGTSLSQLVALCPTCHKATHEYYNNWLKEKDVDDFCSYKEAQDVYSSAKQEMNTRSQEHA